MDVADVISELDDHGFTDSTSARKVAVINDTYWDVAGREPWPFLEKTVSLTFAGGSATASNLPTDFHSIVSADSGNIRLRAIDYEEYQERFGQTAYASLAGTPRFFYFVAGTPSFYPIPASTDTVRILYIQTPPALTALSLEAAIFVPKQYHRGLLVNGALYKLYAMEDDTDLAAGFQGWFEQTLQRMREFVWRRQYQDPTIIKSVDFEDTWGGD